MPRLAADTRDRIVSAAAKLFYGEGIRRVSLDVVAAKAGVTKRTFYYHFRSKDDLVEAYLTSRDLPNLTLFQRWFAETDGELAAKLDGIFRRLARAARSPKWKGCGFLRTSVELVDMPGHPAMKAAAAHKTKVETWLRTVFETEGIEEASKLARQMMLLMDGAFAIVLLHRDPSYMETAGEAAAALIDAARRVRHRASEYAPIPAR